MPRNEVREVLLARLEPGTVRFGRRAVGYSECPDAGYVDVDVEVEVMNHDYDAGGAEGTAAASRGATRGMKIGGGAGRPEWSEEEEKRRAPTDGEGGGAADGRPNAAETRAGDARRVAAASADVEKIRASVLVAADGVRSAVQRVRLPDKTLNYLGKAIVVKTRPCPHPPTHPPTRPPLPLLMKVTGEGFFWFFWSKKFGFFFTNRAQPAQTSRECRCSCFDFAQVVAYVSDVDGCATLGRHPRHRLHHPSTSVAAGPGVLHP